MGKVSLTAVAVWSLVGLAGCSAIAGLDGIQEESCAPNCGDAATGDSQVPGDSSMMGDSTQADTQGTPDTSMSIDSGMMADTGGGGQDSGVVDTGSVNEAAPFDAGPPFDSGCGDLNTTANCSACGDQCAAVGPTQTSASCCSGSNCPGSTDGQGNSCTYTCATGHLDCNGPAGTMPPNLDGCECAVSTGVTQSQCCSGDCPVMHVTGLVGQSYYPLSDVFYDCVPTASGVNLQLALDACAAYVVARNGTAATNCGEFGPQDGGPPDSVCAITAGNCGSSCTGYLGDCICWTASGTYRGQVLDPVAQGLDDQCYIGNSSLTFH